METVRMNGLDWSKDLLDGGKSHTQQEWIEWCSKNGWRLPTAQEYISLFEGMESSEKHLLWQKLKELFCYVMTSTIINERVVVLGVSNNGRFDLYANNIIDYNGSAFGVRIKKTKRVK